MLLQLLLGQSNLVAQPQPQALIPPSAGPASTLPPSTPSSPMKSLPRPIPLAEFCFHYNIPADTEEKLKKLEIIPGDVRGILSLERCDWAVEGGFTKLGWDRFKDIHKRFMDDIRNGAFT